MRIGSSLPLLPTSVSDRGYGVGSRARQNQPVQDATEQVSRAAPRARSQIIGGSGQGASEQTSADQNLSSRSLGALQSYRANGPSLSERLGVELAGIDVRV